MSDAGTQVDNLATIITTAVSGATVSKEAISSTDFTPESFPFVILLQTDYGVTPLDWRQENRAWTFTGVLFVDGETDTRETVQAHLEAIRDAIESDSTLSSTVDLASMVLGVADDHPDSPLHAGDFEITTELVV